MPRRKKVPPEESGRRGGLIGGPMTSPAKARSSRANGKLGGRPRKKAR